MRTIAVINGPNLNLLGTREPDFYGNKSLDSIQKELEQQFTTKAKLSFFQSNHEGVLIDYVQSLKNIDAIVINPGAFTHTSVALRDALVASKFPAIEVHLSNIFAREPFRSHSYFSDICKGLISGFGPLGYALAIEAIVAHL